MNNLTGNNLTGNNLSGNNLTGNKLSPNNGRFMGISDLLYPNLEWAEDDYAHLKGRLDLYTDFIVLSKFSQGEVAEQYIVDPAEVAAALAGINLNSGLLPERCLFWSKKDGYDRLGVYVPPRVWHVSVRGQEQAWRAPLPGLVFVGCEYDYCLWAVAEAPTDRRVQLFLAPCPNVHPKGVCLGNAPFPRAGPATIWQAVDVFFSSKFNRDLSDQKSRAYPKCVLDQWQALHQAGAERYPLADLVGTNLNLGRLIDANY
jgi:hypothetical protein